MTPSRTLALLAAILAVAFLTGCEPTVTQENYDQIELGMTLGQIEQILGRGREEKIPSGVGISGAGLLSGGRASTQRMYVWEDGYRRIVITFEDGKAVAKNSSGL
jgi:hypothetical protein